VVGFVLCPADLEIIFGAAIEIAEETDVVSATIAVVLGCLIIRGGPTLIRILPKMEDPPGDCDGVTDDFPPSPVIVEGLPEITGVVERTPVGIEIEIGAAIELAACETVGLIDGALIVVVFGPSVVGGPLRIFEILIFSIFVFAATDGAAGSDPVDAARNLRKRKGPRICTRSVAAGATTEGRSPEPISGASINRPGNALSGKEMGIWIAIDPKISISSCSRRLLEISEAHSS